MKQGKCPTCKKRLEWIKEIHSRDCFCPSCGEQLQTTNHLFKKWPTVKQNPDSRARMVFKKQAGFFK